MKHKALAFMALLALVFAGCSEIFEKNIEDETVVIIAPADATVTELQTLQFWWEEIDGADEYDFELVYPDFVSPTLLLIDSTVSRNLVTFSLSPGFSYTWRVRAINGAYESGWTEGTLTVDSALSCLDQIVLLTAPAEGVSTIDSVIFFDWEPLSCATEYEWEAADASGTVVAGPYLFSEDSATIEVPEGALIWKVRAIEDQTSTFQSISTLYVDRTAPATPVLNAPVNNDSIGNGTAVTFTWTSETSTNSPITDYFELWPDSLQSAPYFQDGNMDGMVAQDSLPDGTYYWRVQSEDAAGNVSDWTGTRILKVE